MIKTDILVVGGGPGGLGAAIEAARMGAKVMLVDENSKPGGQLYKQIHKFFGSKEHYAGIRGFQIADELIREAKELGVDVRTQTRALGVLDRGEVAILNVAPGEVHHVEKVGAKKVVLATGAKENSLPFEGWTLPGVMGAGAAQTFANVHGVLVGKNVVVVGSGNVGLIVSYQLMQAGANVLALVEALPRINGYAVHAAKIKRAGVPVYLSHTVVRADGEDHVESVTIAEIDKNFQPIPGTEKTFGCDTVLLAVGLSPRTDMIKMFGCKMTFEKRLGGAMPLHDETMRSTNPDVYVCGDLAGVEEASTALDEGRVAGIRAAQSCGYAADEVKLSALAASLDELRGGEVGKLRREAKKDVVAAMKEVCCDE